MLQCCSSSGRGRDNCYKQTCIDCCLIGYCMDNVTVSEQYIITLYIVHEVFTIVDAALLAEYKTLKNTLSLINSLTLTTTLAVIAACLSIL